MEAKSFFKQFGFLPFKTPPLGYKNEVPIWAYSKHDGEPVCGAVSFSGRVCQRKDLGKDGRCKLEGHTTLPRIGYETSGENRMRREKALEAAGILDTVMRSLSDPSIGMHNDNIALSEAFIEQIVAGLAPPEEVSDDLVKILELALQNLEKENYQTVQNLIETAQNRLQTLKNNAKCQDRALYFMAEQRKHRESADKQAAILQTMIPYNQMVILVKSLTNAIEVADIGESQKELIYHRIRLSLGEAFGKRNPRAQEEARNTLDAVSRKAPGTSVQLDSD